MRDELIGVGAAARLVGISASRLRDLTADGVLSASMTPGGHRRYDPAQLKQEWATYRAKQRNRPEPPLWQHSYPLAGLEEDDVWAQMRDAIVETAGGLPTAARSILSYGVTEMVNNAIDHSSGTHVVVSCWLHDRVVTVCVADDGVGAFCRMAETFDLPDAAAAVVEITKGKRTTSPRTHSGEGIFFTSKAVDAFELEANGYRVVFDNLVGDVALGESTITGTTAVLRLSLDTGRDMAELFAQFTTNGEFDRTVPRIQLISHGGEFVSRSEAKRFAVGLEKFRRVVLDFTDVPMVGQGFADELFRVWQQDHLDILLDVIGANAAVALMINRVPRPGLADQQTSAQRQPLRDAGPNIDFRP